MSPEPPDSSLPTRLREFHARLPLEGGRPNALLSLPDDRVLYLAAVLRDTPVPAPALTPDEWRAFRDILVPHGVFPLLAYRLRAWPEDCRPPREVTDYLNRLFLYAAARSMRAGRARQQHYSSQGRPFIEPRVQGRPIGPPRRSEILYRVPPMRGRVQWSTGVQPKPEGR